MKENNIPQDVLDVIKCLFHEGRTDQQVSQIIQIPIIEVVKIRKTVLGIMLYDRKIVCGHCNEPRSVFSFSKKSEHPDWCCLCRKLYGGEKGSGRPLGRGNDKKKKRPQYVERLCLRCSKPFKSIDHSRLCNHCSIIITSIERASI